MDTPEGGGRRHPAIECSRPFGYRGNPDLRILIGTPRIEQLNVKLGEVRDIARHEDQLTGGTTEAAR